MKNLFFVAITLLLCSCGQQSDKVMTDVQKAKITEEVKPFVTQLWESNYSLDYEKWLVLYWNSSDFIFIANGQSFMYNDVAAFKEMWKSLEYQKYTPTYEKYDVLAGDAVLYIMLGKVSVKFKTGDIMDTDKYAFTALFKKVDGTWKIVSGHASFPMPVPPAQPGSPEQNKPGNK